MASLSGDSRYRMRRCVVLIGMIVALLPLGKALAQDPSQDDAAERRNQAAQDLAARRQRENFLNDVRQIGSRPNPEGSSRSGLAFLHPVDADLVIAIPDFRTAVEEFGYALSSGDALEKSLKTLDEFIDDFKDYFKKTNIPRPDADKEEFRDFSNKDLLWETLTSAERVDNDLHRAAEFIKAANRSGTVSIHTINFMHDLHGQVLRLEVLISLAKKVPSS